MPYDGGEVYVKVELYINGAFVEVTTRARGGRAASGVEIERGRGTGAIQAETSICKLTLGNPDAFVTEGNPESPWYPHFGRGCRIRVSIADVGVSDVVRFDGEIDTIVAVYPGGSDSSVRITATGILGGQLGLGSDPPRSALERTILADDPIAAWTFGDGTGAQLGGSAISGGRPMLVVSGTPTFGSNVDLPPGVGTSAIDLTNASMSGLVAGGSASAWSVEFVATAADAAAGALASIYIGAGSWERLDIYAPFAGSSGLQFVTRGGGGAFTGTWSIAAGWHHYLVTAAQSGGNVNVRVYQDGTLVASPYSGAGTLGPVTEVNMNSVLFPTSTAMSFADAAIHNQALDATAAANRYEAVLGYVGELVHVRMARLCAEDGIALTITGTSTQTMGAQLADTLANLLIDGEAVDGGLLSDGSDGGDLDYRCLSSITNQDASLAVTQGSLDVDVAPIWDNRNIRNDVTISRPGGSSARVTDEAHIARTRRRIKDSDSANVETDIQLDDQAGWRVAIGTADGPRYNGVGINLRNTYGKLLADAVLALEAGDRFTAATATLPPQHPPGGIDGLVIGWREELDKDKWLFAPNVVPYAPYQVGVYGVDPGGIVSRYGAANTVLAEDLTTVETAADVNTGTDTWATTASHASAFPFDVTIGGLDYSCTAITGTHPNLTLTLVRLATDKAHSTGAAVTVTDTGRYGL